MAGRLCCYMQQQHSELLAQFGSKCLCSEISCNVKLNVYLAMKIPDCVSFVSG